MSAGSCRTAPTSSRARRCGIIELLERSGIDIAGKHAVVIGRSDIVGKPVSLLLLHRHATVTICHSRTQDLPAIAASADILIAALGRPGFVRRSFVKPGATVIDVGINLVTDATVAKAIFHEGHPREGSVRAKGLGAGRRRPSRSCRGRRRDHAGSRRSRSADDRHADGEHAEGGGAALVHVDSPWSIVTVHGPASVRTRSRRSARLSPDRDHMLKVALTGGIATGKSYVLARLRERGVPTIDADDVVHEALGPGTPTTKAIATQFGRRFSEAGRQHRSGASRRKSLQRSREPAASSKRSSTRSCTTTIRNWYETLDRPLGVASIPLLYETRREGDFDFVAVTVCPPEQQLQRIARARTGFQKRRRRQRIAAQMPAEEKARRANFVILTGGTTTATDRQVDELLIAIHNFRR